MGKQKQHYLFMAALMLLIAFIACFRFDLENGYYWLIPCFFGFLGGGYIYAVLKI